MAHRLWVAGIIALSFSAPTAAREEGVPVATESGATHLDRGNNAQYRTARRDAAARDGAAWTVRRARRLNRSKALHRSGVHSVAQISPTILRRAGLSLEDGAHPRCTSKFRRRSTACNAKPARPKDLVDALLEAPSPATVPILRDLGIPAIRDVPPIAILRAAHPNADKNDTADQR